MNNGYLGYDSKARKIYAIYVGANAKAHICTKAYVGDTNNKARLAFKFKVDIPTLEGAYVYNTQEQSVVINNLNAKFVTVSGTTKATNAGTYTVTFSLKNSTITWSDGTKTDKTATWTIAKSPVTMVVTKLAVQKSGSYISPSTYTDYEYVVRAKLGNTNIMLDLPISVSGQYDAYNYYDQYSWHNYGDYYSHIDYSSTNRFSCHCYIDSAYTSEDYIRLAGNAKISVSIPESTNTQACSAITYNGSNTHIYHQNEHTEGEVLYIEGDVYAANVTV